MSKICSTLLIIAALSVHALATTPADRIFPDATKGFVSVSNLEKFGEQWQQTQFAKLLENPLMHDFRREVEQQIAQRLENTFALSLDNIYSLPAGELAFGMVAIPGQTPGYVLTLDVAGKRAETERYLAELAERLVNAGARRTTETHRGQQITVLIFPPPQVVTPRQLGATRIEIAIEPIERRAHYMFVQDILIASDQLHLLCLIADRIADRTGRSLADVEAYQVTMRRCIADLPAGVEPSIRWFIDPLNYGESIRVLLRGPVAQNRRDRPSVFAILKQQGFDALQGIGGVVTVKAEEQETVYRTFIYTRKPYRLAMQMLNFPGSTDFVPPAWMPADLARCTMFNVAPMAIFDNIGSLFDAFFGEEVVWNDILDGLRTDPHGPQIDVREELVANLGNRVFGMSHYARPITIDSERLVVAVELLPGREAAMQAGLEKMFGNDPEMQATQHNTHRIWHRKPEDLTWNDSWGSENEFSFGLVETVTVPTSSGRNPLTDEDDPPPLFPFGGVVVARGCIFVATNIDYLMVILDRLDNPASSAQSTIGREADYLEMQQVFASMGMTERPRFFQFFARAHETMRPTYETIRQGQMGHSQSVGPRILNAILSPEEETGVRRQVLDGRTLPEFERIQHYFGKLGIYGVTESQGYFIKGFTVER